MRKLLFLLPFFLFACTKNEKSTRISIRQLPSKIDVYRVDTGTGVESLLYEIAYFFNDKTSKFDSIIFDGKHYVFDYSLLNTQQKILLNYIDTTMAYGEIRFDANLYTLTSYREVEPSPGTTLAYTLEYDGTNRIKKVSYATSPPGNTASITHTYSSDTIFRHSVNTFASCTVDDTIINSNIEMSTTLPWLLFTDINSCSSISQNLLKALPVSNYPNKLPQKIKADLFEIAYSYTGDAYSRLSLAQLEKKERATGIVTDRFRIRLQY